MKLGRLWYQHQQFDTQGLKENFGDGYLIAHNKIYRNIRTSTLAQKFTFSLGPYPLYQALPLSQLEWILSEKIIPYFDNVSVLQQIHQKLPQNIFWDDISDNLKGNHVFHESCHAVARGKAQEILKSPDLTNKSDLQLLILCRLIDESFANTCELLAVTDATDPVHQIFFELNSYVVMFEDRSNLKKAMQEIGEEIFMHFMILCYLHANFLTPTLTDQKFEKILSLIAKNGVGFSGPQKKSMRALSKIAFELNLRFRMVTTSFYFRLNGIFLPKDQLRDFDFIQTMIDRPELMEFLDALIKKALR